MAEIISPLHQVERREPRLSFDFSEHQQQQRPYPSPPSPPRSHSGTSISGPPGPLTSRPLTGVDEDQDINGSSAKRQRIAKACETCRNRRVKCSGDIPCKSCKDAGTADKCFVRVKARPNRPTTTQANRKSSGSAQSALTRQSRHPEDTNHSDPFQLTGYPSTISPLLALSHASLLPSAQVGHESQPRLTPLDRIERHMATWCELHELPMAHMIFQDETRLSALYASPLPPDTDIEAFEDELMRHLIITNDLEQASSLDRLQIVTLYNRYRIFPTALTADQRALVYAALCLAKHAIMKSDIPEGSPIASSATREDVTYFRMACECLAQWSFPSVHALWALVCLVPYSQGNGGLAENRELLRMMAWQVRKLGLHRTDMGKLYLSDEMSLFPLFRYMDTFLAGLDDLNPWFTLAESDVDLSAFAQLLSPCQQAVSNHAARFHDDFNDPTIDITSDDYVFLAESRWIPSLAQLQSGNENTSKSKRGWSEIRYYWLRILLYFPRTSFDTVRANHAWIIVSHCIAQIIYIHHELALIGLLNPSWPQLRRFSICGQVLVLSTSRHLYQPRQAEELFEKLLFLLEAHRESWASAGDLLRGYQKAAVALGLNISHMSPSTVMNLAMPPPRNPMDAFNLEDFSFPFDPTVFFAPDAESTAVNGGNANGGQVM